MKPLKRKRLKAEVRKEELIALALQIAVAGKYTDVTRNGLALAAGVSGSAVQYHFSTMDKMRSEVMRAAVKQEVLIVIVQGLVDRHPQALKASDDLKRAAVTTAYENT